ncbi:hypothetical protein CSPX01_04432 [Colletotrichum filicis]|nr:hypothetical protein CSPX01_04432 [Colletotrichum filicis]
MSAPRHGISPIVPMAQPPPSCSWPDYPISAQPIVWFSGHPTVASQQHMAKTLKDFRDGRFFAAPGFWSPPRPTRHSTLAGLPPPAIATTTVAPPLPPREHNALLVSFVLEVRIQTETSIPEDGRVERVETARS